MRLITCRAKLADDCLDGATTFEHFGEDLPMSEDGTWIPNASRVGGSIICDACYVRLMPLTPNGRGLIGDLPIAIKRYREKPSDRS